MLFPSQVPFPSMTQANPSQLWSNHAASGRQAYSLPSIAPPSSSANDFSSANLVVMLLTAFVQVLTKSLAGSNARSAGNIVTDDDINTALGFANKEAATQQGLASVAYGVLGGALNLERYGTINRPDYSEREKEIMQALGQGFLDKLAQDGYSSVSDVVSRLGSGSEALVQYINARATEVFQTVDARFNP